MDHILASHPKEPNLEFLPRSRRSLVKHRKHSTNNLLDFAEILRFGVLRCFARKWSMSVPEQKHEPCYVTSTPLLCNEDKANLELSVQVYLHLLLDWYCESAFRCTHTMHPHIAF